jgi:hypothetical protein
MGCRSYQHLWPSECVPTLIRELVKARQNHDTSSLLHSMTSTLFPIELERTCLRRNPHADVKRNAGNLCEIFRRTSSVVRIDFPFPESSRNIVDKILGDLASVFCQYRLFG